MDIKSQIKSDITTAIIARNMGKNLIFGYLGMSGIGKTQMVKQAAEELGLEFFGDMVLSQCSPMDIMGKVPNMEDEVLSSLPNDDIPLEYRVGKTAGVWFVDEVTNATSDTLKAIQQGLLSRTFGKHALGENVIIVLAGNRQSDKAGSGVLSSAIYNRVTWRNLAWNSTSSDRALEYLTDQYVLPDPDADESVTKRQTEIMALINGYFSHDPMLEKDFTDALGRIGREPFVQWCSPRSLEALIVRIAAMKWQLPSIEDMSGDIGMGRATSLFGFFNLLGVLPKYEKVISEPDTAKVPEAMDAKYAMVAMLSTRIDAQGFEPAWTYVRRFANNTLKIVFLRMALKLKGAEIRSLPAYKNIFKDDADLREALMSV